MRAERTPVAFEAAPDVTGIDTSMAGERELNAVYLLPGPEPTIVEAGPGADGPVIIEGLRRLGIGRDDLAHIVVTHVHLDHAGGAGALASHYPAATIWVHQRGARHLADPRRLIASTARTYGEARMRDLYGDTHPVPAGRIRAVDDGDRIELGGRALDVLHTPGHASHHVALHDSGSGALFTGEAIGSHLPWADCYRPALPAPEVDLEAAFASIRRILAARPTSLLTSHFGPVANVEEAAERAAQRIRAWSGTVEARLREDPTTDVDELTRILTRQAGEEFFRDAGVPIDLDRYDVLGSIRMNAEGLSRYWRKRWEREGADRHPAPPDGPGP